MINKEVPRLAIQTFAEERVTELAAQIGRLYAEWKKLNARLPTKPKEDVPEPVRRIIEYPPPPT